MKWYEASASLAYNRCMNVLTVPKLNCLSRNIDIYLQILSPVALKQSRLSKSTISEEKNVAEFFVNIMPVDDHITQETGLLAGMVLTLCVENIPYPVQGRLNGFLDGCCTYILDKWFKRLLWMNNS